MAGKRCRLILWCFVGLLVVPSLVFSDFSNPGVEIEIKPGVVLKNPSEQEDVDGSLQDFVYRENKMSTLYNQKMTNVAERSIPVFNQWFDTNVKNLDELTTAAAGLITRYYNQLRQCLPGKFKYPTPNVLFGLRINDILQPKFFFTTSIIYGYKDHKCAVVTRIEKYPTPLRMICFYNSDYLNFFSDEKAKAAAINYLRYTQDDLQKLEKIANDCKIIPENQPISDL